MGSIAPWLKTSIAKYDELFTPLTGIPPNDRVRHAIQLIPGALPIMKRPYRLSAEQKKSANEQIRNAMKERLIYSYRHHHRKPLYLWYQRKTILSICM